MPQLSHVANEIRYLVTKTEIVNFPLLYYLRLYRFSNNVPVKGFDPKPRVKLSYFSFPLIRSHCLLPSRVVTYAHATD